MNAIYDVPAPAKLNLFLHIVGRRPDGYHLLQSVFMLIDWQDTLHFEKRPQGLSREDLSVALPEDDLVLRAARALQAATGYAGGAHIAIDKRIPAQAGMGGGSSDAASCLLALNRLWGLGLGQRALAQIGLSLGADVPFFLYGRNAWVEGIGERLQPVHLPAARFWVLKPTAGLATASIFSAQDLQRDTKTAIIEDFAAADSGEPASLWGWGRNDMQPVARRLCSELGVALDWLESHGLPARMTGSGSAVFAWAPDFGARTLTAPPSVGELRLCSNMEVHPLAGWAFSDDS